MRRLVREEFIPAHVFERMKTTALQNTLFAKTMPEFAIEEEEAGGDYIPVHPLARTGNKSRTGSNASNASVQSSNSMQSQQSVQSQISIQSQKSTNSRQSRPPRKNPPLETIVTSVNENAESPPAITAAGTAPEQQDASQDTKKRPRRRSSAEKRAARRERDRIALQKLKAAVQDADYSNDCAVQSPLESPLSASPLGPLSPLDLPSPFSSGLPSPTSMQGSSSPFPFGPLSPVVGGSPALSATGSVSSENTPPAGQKRPRRRSSGNKRRPRSGSAGTEDSAAPTTGVHNPGANSVRGPGRRTPPKVNMLHLLLAPTSLIELPTLFKTLKSLLFPSFPEISTVEVPLHASTSQAQADDWSAYFWPAIYKRGNPFGPHPPHVDHTIAKTLPKCGDYMRLARAAGRDSLEAGHGLGIGAVVVDPSNEEVIAVAGDARHVVCGGDGQQTWGNPLEHAVLRAVGMVAAKRKHREQLEIGTAVTIQEGIELMKQNEGVVRHKPLTELERKHFYTLSDKSIKNTAIVNVNENNQAAADKPAQEDFDTPGDDGPTNPADGERKVRGMLITFKSSIFILVNANSCLQVNTSVTTTSSTSPTSHASCAPWPSFTLESAW